MALRSDRPAEELLLEAQPQRPRRMRRRELTVEGALSATVLVAALAWPLAQGVDGAPWRSMAVCVAAYAISASVVLFVGAGCALPTQLAFVPMLWILPAPLVPLCVVVALCLWALPDVVARRHSPERLLTAVGNAAYAFAPAAVFAIAGARGWGIVLVAFAAQCVFDGLLSVGREWLSRGIAPPVQLEVMASVYGVDALLLPVAVVVAQHAQHQPAAVLSVVPLSLLLMALARDRTRRIAEAASRLEQLERERERVNVAIHRVGRSLGAGHDRIVVLEVALGTAVDAVGAAAGRARLAGIPREMTFEAVPRQPGAAEAAALRRVERDALAGLQEATAEEDGWHALAHPLAVPHDGTRATIGAMAVCRTTPFSAGEGVLLGYLAAQTAASIQAIDLHDRLRSELSLDVQTGLANPTRFRDLLRRAATTDGPVSVLLIGLDRIDELNHPHGSELEDTILRATGAALRDRARIVDEPARIRADRFGIVLAGATEDAARVVGDDIRAAIAATAVPFNGAIVRPTASVGVAARSALGASGDELLHAAELALEHAQSVGGNSTAVAHGERHSKSAR